MAPAARRSVPQFVAAVRSTLYGLGHDHGPSVEAYRVLLDEAERMRRELVLIGGYANRLAEPSADPRAAAELRNVLGDVARVLDAGASALVAGQPVDAAVIDPVRLRVRAALTVLDDDGGSAAVTRRAAAARVRGLAGQAGLADPDGFTRSWYILMKGSIVSAAEGYTDAAKRAKAMATRLIEDHRRPGVSAPTPDAAAA